MPSFKFPALGKALSVSVLNQFVSSGTNFVLGMYLVRVLTPAEFGMYGIGFAISLYYSGIGNALFLTQMVVHLPDKPVEEKLPYASRILISILVCCLATVIISGLVFLAGGTISKQLSDYSQFGFAVTAASTAYLLKDFFVRHAYSYRKELWALIVNSSMAAALVLLLVIQHKWFHSFFSYIAALWIYAISQGVAAFIGGLLARLPVYSSFHRGKIIDDLKLNWEGGRWAFGGMTVTWLQSQAYMYVTALFLGPAGVGSANAARLLIAPFTFLMPAVNQVTMPQLAALRVTDQTEMLKNGKKYTFGMMGLAVLYMIALYFSYETLTMMMIGKRYSNIGPLVAMWCVTLLFQLSRDGAGTLLQSLKKFKALMLDNTVSALVAVSAAALLVRMLGIPGAILGTASGELMLAILLWKRIREYGRHPY